MKAFRCWRPQVLADLHLVRGALRSECKVSNKQWKNLFFSSKQTIHIASTIQDRSCTNTLDKVFSFLRPHVTSVFRLPDMWRWKTEWFKHVQEYFVTMYVYCQMVGIVQSSAHVSFKTSRKYCMLCSFVGCPRNVNFYFAEYQNYNRISYSKKRKYGF